MSNKTTSLPFVPGQLYSVILNDVEYQCVAWQGIDNNVCIGNGDIYGGTGMGGDEPFSCDSYEDGTCYLNVQTAGTYMISISTIVEEVHKIDKKYLPEMSSVGKEGDAEGAEIFNDYENNVASVEYAHAEGTQTTASGYAAHAEGGSTIASGVYSHAEGVTTEAANYYAHAEGGWTKAKGKQSHAEGNNTTASGESSHSEGQYTIANGEYQHVQGKFNISDSNSVYAHIVGNGTSNSARSNAHTLDWSGNAWFEGDVYVGSTGGTNKDEGSKLLATQEYVDSALTSMTKDEIDAICGATIYSSEEVQL